jgi:phosphomannomutase
LILFSNLFFWCCLIAEKPLEGFHIVVDAGNGAGGFFAVSLFNLEFYFVVVSVDNYFSSLS